MWRTTWTLKALTLLKIGSLHEGRERSLAGVVDQVIDGFEPERRLRGLDIHTAIDGPASGRVDEEAARLVLTGAVLMMVESFRAHENPGIDVHVNAPATGAVVFEVKQWSAAISADTIRAFAASPGTPGVSPMLAVWAAALKTATALRHGTAELLVDETRGSILRCTLRTAHI